MQFFDSPNPKRHPEDVGARDYVEDWGSNNRLVAGNVDWLKGHFLPGVHKRLAHISVHRVRVPAQDDAMQVVDIYLSLASMMELFLEQLSAEKRQWFERNGELPITGMAGIGFDR